MRAPRHQMPWRHLAMALAACALPASASANGSAPAYVTPDGAVRVVGYNDMDEMLADLTSDYSAIHPGLRFDLVLKGTRTAPPALIDGSSAFAPMGAELSDSDRKAYAALRGGAPVEIRIAHDSLKAGALSSPIGVFVASGNPLTEISMADVRRVFAASVDGREIRTWGGLGLGGSWRDRPLHPMGLGSGTAIGAFLLSHALHGPAFRTGYRGFPQSREVAAAIGHDRFAIAFAKLGDAKPGMRALTLVDGRGRRERTTAAVIRSGRYPLDRFLLIYARRNSRGEVEPLAASFLRFALSGEGQSIIARGTKGYLPLSPRERLRELEKLEPLRIDKRG